jgi:hypothetical protein
MARIAGGRTKESAARHAAGDSYDVFISYRRKEGSAQARLLREALSKHGLRVFLDVTDLQRGHFDDSLLQQIAKIPNFLVVLAPNSLDPCSAEGDWLRHEIAHAIATRRNIVPVMLPPFEFPATLPSDIADRARHQGVEYSHVFFEATVDKILGLVNARGNLKSRPIRLSPALMIVTIVLGAGIFFGYVQFDQSDQQVLANAITDVRQQFRRVRDLQAPSSDDLAPIEKDISTILKIDPKNGTGLYYSGELKRLRNPAMFTKERCLIPAALSGRHDALDVYESDFYRYLDIEYLLPDEAKGGDPRDSELCYTRTSGYCPQRTLWIKNLLAVDLYEEALSSDNPTTQADLLRRAHKFAEDAAHYKDPNGNVGFVQCRPRTTTAVIQAIEDKLNQIRESKR